MYNIFKSHLSNCILHLLENKFVKSGDLSHLACPDPVVSHVGVTYKWLRRLGMYLRLYLARGEKLQILLCPHNKSRAICKF